MESSTGINNTNNNIDCINIIMINRINIPRQQIGGARNEENRRLKQTLKELRYKKKLFNQLLNQKIQKTKDDKKMII